MVTPRYEPSLPKLRLELPYRLAGLSFAFVEDYNHDGSLADQGAGISLRYESETDINHADLFEYDWNQPDLPPGILSHAVLHEFFHAQGELHQGLESGYYTSLTYLEQRITVAPAPLTDPSDDPFDDDPETAPLLPPKATSGESLEWLAATYMATLPRQDGGQPGSRVSEPDPSQIGDADPGDKFGDMSDLGWDGDDVMPDEESVLVHVFLTAHGGQFIKLRYTHSDVDDPEPERRCLEFLNQISTLLLNHRIA